MNWAGSLGADSKSCRERIKDHYGSIPDVELKKALGKDGLLLDYYIGEIVEDRMLIAAASRSSNTTTEIDITITSPDNKKSGRSLLSMLLEANEHWMSRETRLAYLKKAAEGFVHKGHKEHLKAMLLKSDFSDLPDSIEPRLEQTLLDPVKDALSHCRHLAIVPFSYLNNFPFHALPTIVEAVQNGRLQSIIYTPSVKLYCGGQTWESSKKKESRRSCLFVGYDAANILAIDRELAVVKKNF